jgi:hypothetical protein
MEELLCQVSCTHSTCTTLVLRTRTRQYETYPHVRVYPYHSHEEPSRTHRTHSGLTCSHAHLLLRCGPEYAASDGCKLRCATQFLFGRNAPGLDVLADQVVGGEGCANSGHASTRWRLLALPVPGRRLWSLLLLPAPFPGLLLLLLLPAKTFAS